MMKRKTMGRVVPLLTAMSLLGNIALAAGTAVINDNATVKIGADTADSNALSARIDASAGASVMLSPDGTYLKKGVSKDDDYKNNRLEESLDGNHDVARVVIRGQRTDFGLNTDASQTGTAIGANAQAKKDNAVAVGNGANVHGNNSSAFGSGAVVGEDDGNGHHNNADNGLALGANSLVKGTATNSVALGVGSVADEANTVSVGTSDSQRRITNVAEGTKDNDAVSLKQLTNAIKTVADTAGSVVNTASAKIGSALSDSFTGKAPTASVDATTGASVLVTPDGSYNYGGTRAEALERVKETLAGDTARVVIRGQRSDFGLNAWASQTGTALGANTNALGANSTAVGNGATVEKAAKNGLALGANSKVSAENSVALGAGSVASEANTVSVGSDTVKRRLTNLADGTQPSDAATYSQLTTISNQFNTSLDNLYSSVDAKLDNLDNRFDTKLTNLHNQLDNRINEVGAGAAAMAALHPLDFDPTEKLSFAVGYGNYKNANAAAIGAFYYPNPNVLVSLGTSVGEGNGMLNAGVSFKLGQGSTATSSRAALQSKVNELTKTNEALTAENQALKANDEAQDTRIAKLEQQVLALTKQLQK